MLDLGPKARVAFAAVFIAAELLLVAHGLSRPDKVFGFQMFNESSKIRFRLFRRVRGETKLLPIESGAWSARDTAGNWHTFQWKDRIRYPPLARPNVFVHASYGLDAQLFRLQKALNDVISHVPEDNETIALVAIVDPIRNGRAEKPIHLVGARP